MRQTALPSGSRNTRWIMSVLTYTRLICSRCNASTANCNFARFVTGTLIDLWRAYETRKGESTVPTN